MDRNLCMLSKRAVLLLPVLLSVLVAAEPWTKRLSMNIARRQTNNPTCTDPRIPENGFKIGAMPFYPGHSVQFGCNSGYKLKGTEIITCTYGTHGVQWNAEAPKCTRTFQIAAQLSGLADPCGMPPEASTFAFQRLYTRGVLVEYQCINGYTRQSGDAQLTCSNSQWQGELLQCRKLGQCRDYGNLHNGYRIIDGTTEGSTVAFGCNDEYDLLGNRQLTCASNGLWIGAWPLCVRSPAECGDPSTPVNGSRRVLGTTEGSIVIYSCQAGYSLSGDLERTCLQTGEWSGSLPICNRISCPQLSSPAHGSIQYSSLTSSSLVHAGSVATYSCNPGYAMSGVNSSICNGNGTWSNDRPSCNYVVCASLRHPANGRIRVRETTFGATANYSCFPGYGLVGIPTRICQSDRRWSGSIPSCISGRCSTLQDPQNGRVTYGSMTIRSIARYFCDLGYLLSGPSQRSCQPSGWSGTEPTCEPVRCPRLVSPFNGAVATSEANLVYSVATYTCNTNYAMIGVRTRQCQPIGIWSDRPPGCYKIICGALRKPHNGKVTFQDRTNGSEATYECNQGYVLRFGDSIRTCMENTQWSGSAPCCIREIVQCPELENPQNGTVDFDTTVGSLATYDCNPGFTLEGEGTRICGATGNWSGTDPTCAAIMCPPLESPENGNVDEGNRLVGDVAVYNCEEGYRIEGDKNRSCTQDGQNGQWTGNDPTCAIVDCGTLMDPDNGIVDHSGGTTFGSTATYICTPPYGVNGTKSRICQANGTWSGDAPICSFVDCGGLQPPENGTVTLSDTTIGSQANYSCNTGFTLTGIATRECLGNGEWSNSAPTCEFVDCGGLQPPENGTVTLSDTTIGSQANYSCNTGFTLTGIATRECLGNGEWSNSAPTCEPFSCPSLDSPTNGTIVFSNGTSLNSQAIYRCSFGSVLQGDTTRTCSEDGWTGQDPTCVYVECPDLNSPTNGIVSVPSPRVFGSVANYSCINRNTLIGQEQRECLATGQWRGNAPICLFIECPVLTDPLNGVVIVNDNIPGEIASYDCEPGFGLMGNTRRQCRQVDGLWTGEEPTCEVVFCPDLMNPANGEVFQTGQRVLAQASYICDPGFVVEGLLVRICLDNGEWGGDDPVCIRIVCPNLPDPQNGQVVQILDGNVPGTVANYFCDEGYTLQGNMSRECVQVGQEEVWTGTSPTCERIMCPALSNPVDGEVQITSRIPGGSAVYLCNAGFTLNGSLVRGCGNDGMWISDEPTCDPNSDTVTCPVLLQSSLQNGILELSTTTVGSIASYTCFLGYQLDSPSDRRQCQSNGMWTGNDPACNPVDCGFLDNPANGIVTIDAGTTLGMIARYSCDAGYLLMEALELRLCTISGQWSGTAPTCEPIDCGSLPNPLNGVVDLSGGTILGSQAVYSCMTGYQLEGNATRLCATTGEWSPLAPTCILVDANLDCGDPGIPINGERILPSTTIGSTVQYSCVMGFVIQGNSSRTCQANTFWSGALPTCVAVMCPVLMRPENGIIFVSGQTVDSRATYFCNNGFTRVGLLQRTCTEDGDWEGEEPVCISNSEIECPPLEDPVRGEVTFNALAVGSTANYTCQSGYAVNGASTRVCQSGGTWSGEEPMCNRLICADPGAPANGRRVGSNFAFGSRVYFVCSDGYNIVGATVLLCQDSKTWDNDTPTCSPANRDIPPLITRGMQCIVGEHESLTCPASGCSVLVVTLSSLVCIVSAALLLFCTHFYITNGIALVCSDRLCFRSLSCRCCSLAVALSSHSTYNLSLALISVEVDTCTGEGEIIDQFGRLCNCTNGQLNSCCRYRQDWTSLTTNEMQRYISAVKTIATNPQFRELYHQLVQNYQTSFDTIAQSTVPNTSQFFPWQRYFLLEYEDLLRLVDTEITIPYWDWSLLPSTPYESIVFDSQTGFGNSADSDTMCVNSGPFREGEFEVTPSAGGGCLRRLYTRRTYPSRQLIEQDILPIQASNFEEFHSSLQLFIHLNVRCFVGGHMCSVDAANDPLYPLHLARVDLTLNRWQSSSPDRAAARYVNENTPLALSFDDSLLVSDFSSNTDLPYGTCTVYAQLQDPVQSTVSLPRNIQQSNKFSSQTRIDCLSEVKMKQLRMPDQDRAFMRRKCG